MAGDRGGTEPVRHLFESLPQPLAKWDQRLKVSKRFFLEGRGYGLLGEKQQIINSAVHIHWDSLWQFF
jgi:hypothetical protein